MFSVGKIKSMEGFYLQSCSLFSTTLGLNIIFVYEFFSFLWVYKRDSGYGNPVIYLFIYLFNLCWRFSNWLWSVRVEEYCQA